MIALEDVSFAYGQKPVLQAVSLRFPKSGAVCLFGASGCGKTTLLRLLSGLEKPDKGRLTGLEGKRTAMLFQDCLLYTSSLISGEYLAHRRRRAACRSSSA